MSTAHLVKLSFTIHEEEFALLIHAARVWDESLSEVIRRGLYQGYAFLENRRNARECARINTAASSIQRLEADLGRKESTNSQEHSSWEQIHQDPTPDTWSGREDPDEEYERALMRHESTSSP